MKKFDNINAMQISGHVVEHTLTLLDQCEVCPATVILCVERVIEDLKTRPQSEKAIMRLEQLISTLSIRH